MKGILGRKVGMTQIFTTSGKLIPVTVVEIEKNIVTQIKTTEKDGYNAIQLGAFNKKEKASNRAEKGHIKNANTEPKRFLKEIKGLDVSNYQVGQVIDVNSFEVGEFVDVTGTSKGKGFTGAIKRYGLSKGPESHGSTYHRRVGSLGPMRPMRVLKGKPLPGHMGNEQVTIQNLEIVEVNSELNYILVSGNIPGPKNSFVLVKSSIKNKDKNQPIELISYEVKEEMPSEEVKSEVAEENSQELEVANVEETAIETEKEVEEETAEMVEENSEDNTIEEETTEASEEVKEAE